MRITSKKRILSIFIILVILFLIGPLFIVMGISFNSGTIMAFPPKGFSFYWYRKILESNSMKSAFKMSFITATISAFIATIIGFLTAYGMDRHRFKGKSIIETLFSAPMMLPHMITGVSLLTLSQQFRLIGTIFPILIGHVLISFPFCTRIISSSLPAVDPSYEEAAKISGATTFQTLTQITIPLLKPAIISSALFSFVISFTDTSVALFLTTESINTIPVLLFQYLYSGADPGIAAISVLFIIMAVVIVYTLSRLIKLELAI